MVVPLGKALSLPS